MECGEQVEKEQSRDLIKRRAWERGDEAVWQEIEALHERCGGD